MAKRKQGTAKQAKQATQDKREWVGVFAAKGAGAWIERELFMESLPEEAFAPEGAQPVSVRVERETLALLDAFAARFRTSRSGVLLELIRAGLGEAFRALPREEQLKMAEIVRAKAPNAGGLALPPVVISTPLPESKD